MNEIIDFPKLISPFVRDKDHKVTPVIDPLCTWVFTEPSFAVDKLHGTNVCVIIKDGKVQSIDNRKARIFHGMIELDILCSKALIGILKAIHRGWIKQDGRYYGELIGPDINGNLHQIDDYLFVPFDYLIKSCHWKSWVQNKYPKDFDSISSWFKEIPSLFSKKICDKDVLAEGLIFYSADLTKKCKLRRDMFRWYEGIK